MTDDQQTEAQESAEESQKRRARRATSDEPVDHDQIAEEEKDDNPG